MKTMQGVRSRLSLSIILIGVLCVLLPAMAFLQYRWIGQLGESERQRLEEDLDAAASRFLEDLFREFYSVALSFQFHSPTGPFRSEMEAEFARKMQQWNSTAPYPGLVRSVSIAASDLGGELALRRFDPDEGTINAVPWPDSLSRLKADLDEFTHLSGTRPELRFNPIRDRFPASNDDHSVWILAPMSPASERSAGNLERTPIGWILIEIDTFVFASELLPQVIATHFHETDYAVALFEDTASDTVFFRSEATLTREAMASPDLALPALGPELLRRGGLVLPVRRPRPGRGIAPRRFADVAPPIGREMMRHGLGPPAMRFALLGASWELVVQHQLGSLESAVLTLRRRNLIVGLGILALLGVSGVLTIVWAERVRSIGRLQMEFAAGISHELRTPLTTIRTAAHNIASGIVSQPKEVREYAEMVKTEGRRLSQMVDQVIQFAQTESGRRHYELRPVDVNQVVEGALAVTFPSSDEAVGRVRINVDPALGHLLADETALTHALENLIVNAIKYGPADGTIIIEANQDDQTDQMRISVTNSGAAIDPSELERIFEPFYRGQHVGSTPGSGLGLSLVRKMIEGQKGKVTVSSQPGNTRFTLHLPAAPPIAEPIS